MNFDKEGLAKQILTMQAECYILVTYYHILKKVNSLQKSCTSSVILHVLHLNTKS